MSASVRFDPATTLVRANVTCTLCTARGELRDDCEECWGRLVYDTFISVADLAGMAAAAHTVIAQKKEPVTP